MAAERHRIRRTVIGLFVALVVLEGFAQPAQADTGGLVGAVQDVFGAVVAIPFGAVAGTFNGPPVVGTVFGAVGGALQGILLTARGALKLVGVAIPLAAKAAPLIPLLL